MASQTRHKVAVGSAQWVLEERDGAAQLIQEETEEFAFAVRNELEWLNEHMAEVFSQSQFDVIEAFKTPGKIRGKTPRTARKRNGLDTRAPLTDIFAPTTQIIASPRVPKSAKPVARFQVAEDEVANSEPIPPNVHFSDGRGKENADSGYHDMTEEDSQSEPPQRSTPPLLMLKSPHAGAQPVNQPEILQESRPDSDKRETIVGIKDVDNEGTGEEDSLMHEANTTDHTESENVNADTPLPEIPPTHTAASATILATPAIPESPTEGIELDESQNVSPEREFEPLRPEPSPSDQSSPARTLLRKKSSLTFASLPAREPLTTKKSLGPNASRTSQVGSSKGHIGFAGSYFGLSAGAKDTSHPHRDEETLPDIQTGLDERPSNLQRDTALALLQGPGTEASEAELRAQSRASTLRLQERLAMLGKSNPPRLSRSVPTTVIVTQTTVQDSPKLSRKNEEQVRKSVDDADDWIGPITAPQPAVNVFSSVINSPTAAHNVKFGDLSHQGERMVLRDATGLAHLNTVATTSMSQLPSTEIATPSYPKLDMDRNISHTPQGSPTHKKHLDGPLSASKAKLQSMLKSARGMFSSTANVNNNSSKNPLPSDTPAKDLSPSKLPRVLTMEAGPSGERSNEPPSSNLPVRALMAENLNELDKNGSRRSSQRIAKKKAEAFRETEAVQSTENEVKVISEGVIDKHLPMNAAVNVEQHAPDSVQQGPGNYSTNVSSIPSSPPKPQGYVSQLQKPGEIRRLLRPTKEAPKARPAPVSIKLASQRIGQIAPANATLGMALHESLSQPAAARPALAKKTSSSSFATSTSSQSFKASTSSHAGRPKALEAAARKREQDEREALRKAEQKREMERRRAAKVEEDRRIAEEQKAIEQQKSIEAKNAAQRLAAEQRKAEAIKRNEQARKDTSNNRGRVAEDVMNSSIIERVQTQVNNAKNDPAEAPFTKTATTQDNGKTPVPHVNPARPPKRHLDFDDDHGALPLQSTTVNRTTLVEGHPAQKRRRTSEDESVDPPPRPTMAPPIRPSNIHKTLHNKFAQGFLNTAATAAPSMLKTAVTAQHTLQHPKTPHDLAKTSNAKIAFADAQTAAGPSTVKPQHAMHNAKTPGTAFKSSPQYPNGDSIDLPEIATDSEESDDEEGGQFQPPAWANSPALREILQGQQLIDPMQVFGPIAPLMMEEVFKGNKERQAKFRARTSSANWNGPDRLTEDERRRDHAARERLERNGGWVYGAFS